MAGLVFALGFVSGFLPFFILMLSVLALTLV